MKMRRIGYVDFLPVADFGRFVGRSVSDLDVLCDASERAASVTRRLLDKLHGMDIDAYTRDDFLRFFRSSDELNALLCLDTISRDEYYLSALRFYRLRWASARALVYSIRLYRDVFRLTLEN